uniref:Uncharacterized protein n=1 Tax=Solanum lycopersicum TaxID=4081 RepID=A0A3Q7ID29_SOLLC
MSTLCPSLSNTDINEKSIFLFHIKYILVWKKKAPFGIPHILFSSLFEAL